MKPKARIRKLEQKQKPTEGITYIIERDDNEPHVVLSETDNGYIKFVFLGPRPKSEEAQNDTQGTH